VCRLVVFLTDPLRAFSDKGELKARYYNPENLFSEVHFISPARHEIEAARVQSVVGQAGLFIHSVGPGLYAHGWLPFGPVAGILSSVKPAVLRAYDPSFRGALAVYWAKRLDVPSVVSIHADLDEQRRHERRLVHRLRTPLENYALKRATSVMCVTHHVERYAARHGAPSPAVIYNRVDTKRFAPVPDSGRGSSAAGKPMSILTVGRLVPPKFHECLIRAIAPLNVNLTIIGDGFLRAKLERLVNDLGMHQRVTFTATVPHRDIWERYAAADIFAIATHYEGFCIPVLEAMAAGLPVVVSDIEPLREIVGDAGLLVKNEHQAFAAALQTLLSDPDLRYTLGARARRRALTMDGALMEKREADLYRTLLSEK
jgi:glycosyltransferase involved in cell wall biosynthesis